MYTPLQVNAEAAYGISASYYPSVWLDVLANTGASSRAFPNAKILPAYVSLASIAVIILHILVFIAIKARKSNAAESEDMDAEGFRGTNVRREREGLWEDLRRHTTIYGGPNIYAFMLARMAGCLTLLALSIASVVADELNADYIDVGGDMGMLGRKKHHHRGKKWRYFGREWTLEEWLDIWMCATLLYVSMLSVISVSARRSWSRVARWHLTVVLLVTTVVYAYRNVFPLLTYSLPIQDIAEGKLLWAKVAFLILTAIVLPLLSPREYIPADPKNPAIPSPEQTSSLLSLALYNFLDPLVWFAYRVPNLDYSDLAPLTDTDSGEHLKARSFKALDIFSGAKKQHLFLGLMKVFAKEYATLMLLIVIQVTSSFAAPIGIYKLLRYLETGEEQTVRPWVWISWLFFGPLIASVAIQFYIFMATRMLVQVQAILTQLVFEHSLRIRIKAETSGNGSVAPSTATTPKASAPATPDSASDSETANALTVEGSTSSHSPESTVVNDTESPSKQAAIRASDDSDSSGGNLVGKLQNLVTTDIDNIGDGRDFLLGFFATPLQITLCIVFLYQILGWSAFAGLATILVTLPGPGLVAKRVQGVQEKRLKKTDGRVQFVTETMNVLRMVKLFGWENKMNERIRVKREEELVWVRWKQFLDLLSGTMNFLIPIITMIVTYATYTVAMKGQLNASKIFSSMSVFDLLRDQLHIIFQIIMDSMSAKVSLNRMNDFLHDTELLDEYSAKLEEAEYLESVNNKVLGFSQATFSWSNEEHDGALTPSKRRFRLRIDEELIFKEGAINLVVGPTGSGKTSLLMALLGEMHFIPSSPSSWFNLPRAGGIAYAAQESWVQNETIRDNIVFGADFDPVRYKKVLQQCGLEKDLLMFSAGDQTEVGEKGLTLSGGQKARVTLARAVYSKANTILLDDVLAALDVHTSKYIVDNCFKGDLLRGRTVILVTHNVAMASPIASFVVSLHNGHVHSSGTVSEVLKFDKTIAAEVKKDLEELEKADEQVDEPNAEDSKAAGKLIVAEEMQEGHVSWAALKLYLTGLGGQGPVLFFVIFLGSHFVTDIMMSAQIWYLGIWGTQYEKATHPADVSVAHYLGIYTAMLIVGVVSYTIGYIVYVYGAIRASRSIHKRLVESVLGTTLRWLDTTPTSRVIARCTQDIRAVDGPVALYLNFLIDLSVSMLIKLISVIIVTPLFLVPGIIVFAMGGLCGQIYIKAQLSVKRLMSNARAPVLGHFGAAMAGITSIRAYGVQESFKDESIKRINKFSRTARTFYNLNRWICIRIDALGGLFSASLAAYMVYYAGKESATTGFSLNMAVGFSSMILWWVRVLNEFEVQGNSLERIEHYVTIEQEPKSTVEGEPPAYWPASGNIVVEKLSARYSEDGPKVLHDISFEIKSGERVGVVGRTGSGKSSLTLALLRCIFTAGTVMYDGLQTDKINLDALRSSITIIPQMPELLSGTLRQNLDPFDQYDDAVLNDALKAAGLTALQADADESNLTLDSAIASGGSSLSVGEKQILALARAIVRGSKLLILDEATSAIDYKTDTIIQESLRTHLSKDTTLLTVAHRLQTIMDADKIMVLDAGNLVEYDTPKNLLKNPKGFLRSLVDESGDRELLYQMAGV